MTFSRPAIERLIATVESGLQYGELGPYASALKACLEELDHATAHDGDWLSKESRRLCDTILGDRERLRADVARLTAERDALRTEAVAMRPVFDTALGSYGSQRGGHFEQPRPTDAMIELADAIDAYRASKEPP